MGRFPLGRAPRPEDVKRRGLGRSGISVSEIGLGTMTFGSMVDEPTARKTLDKAFDAGVDFLDVAEIYPVPPEPKWAGVSEEICGRWLSGRSRDSVVVATKVAGPSGAPLARNARSSNCRGLTAKCPIGHSSPETTTRSRISPF